MAHIRSKDTHSEDITGLALGLYKAMWSCLETRPKGLKAGLTAWKLTEWFTSSLNSMNAVQAC